MQAFLMRDQIVLAGGFRLDTMGASAIRALGLAQMFMSMGYGVTVAGKFHKSPRSAQEIEGVTIAGVKCRDIAKPVVGLKCRSYVHSAESLVQIMDELGGDRVLAVICYNYPARGLWATIRAARWRGIAPVLDCTEWYGWEGQKILRNLWRLAGVEFRMRILTRVAGNVICASSWLQMRMARQHTVLLPFVLDTTRPEWQRRLPPSATRPVHLVYSGSPGIGMHKDRLPLIIAALARLNADGHDFHMSVAGLTQDQYLTIQPGDSARVSSLQTKLHFLGRIPHEKSLALLRGADFSVFFRESNRVSNTGFATKYVEAATLGLPVISNSTSDIPHYLRDGENGIMARGLTEVDVDDALRRAVSLPANARAAMVATCCSENPFDMRAWQDDASAFLKNLRGLR